VSANGWRLTAVFSFLFPNCLFIDTQITKKFETNRTCPVKIMISPNLGSWN